MHIYVLPHPPKYTISSLLENLVISSSLENDAVTCSICQPIKALRSRRTYRELFGTFIVTGYESRRTVAEVTKNDWLEEQSLQGFGPKNSEVRNHHCRVVCRKVSKRRPLPGPHLPTTGPSTSLSPSVIRGKYQFMQQLVAQIDCAEQMLLMVLRKFEFRLQPTMDPCRGGFTHIFPPLTAVSLPVYRFMPPATTDVDCAGLAPADMSRCVEFWKPCRDTAKKACPVGPGSTALAIIVIPI